MSSGKTPSLWSQLWRKLFTQRARDARPSDLTSVRPVPAARISPVRSTLEPLEGRIAPATLLPGGKGLTYTDADGDHVTITFSKPLFTGAAATSATVLGNVFKFDTGKAHTGAANSTDDVPQQLQLIDLTQLPTLNGVKPAEGVSFTVTAERVDSNHDDQLEGNGYVNIGAVRATSLTLGSVSIAGDLGQIDCGRDNAVTALKSLTLDSLGKFTNTQTGTASYESLIVGGVGTVTVREITGGFLHVVDGTPLSSKPALAKGNIGTLKIADQISARDLTTVASNDGMVLATGNIGTISIGSGVRHSGGASDGLVGGAGTDSGSIIAGGMVNSVTISGDITGGTGINSGVLSVGKDITRLEIKGAVLGGSAMDGGGVSAGGKIGTLKIAYNLPDGTVGSGIKGGLGAESGVISAVTSIDSASILGDIQGISTLPTASTATAHHSGGLSAAVLKNVVLQGSLKGGAGESLSGFLEGTTSLGTIKVTGDVVGGTGDNSGVILSQGAATNITVAGKLAGGAGDFSGAIVGGQSGSGTVASVTVGDGIFGGDGAQSGVISGGLFGKIAVHRLPASTGGDIALRGGLGDGSGTIFSALGVITSLTLDGALSGAGGQHSGSVEVHGTLQKLVAGDLRGGQGLGSGSVSVLDLDNGSAITAGKLVSATVRGLLGGSGDRSGRLETTGNMGTVVTGDLTEGSGEGSGSLQAGSGAFGVGSITSLKVGNMGAPANGTTSALQPGGNVTAYGQLGTFTATQLFQAAVHAGRIGSFTAGSITDSTVVATGGVASPKATSDLALGKLNVTHDVSGSQILAGYDFEQQVVNGHAQIGPVVIGGNWVASSLVAGITDVNHDGYGNADDVRAPANDGSALTSKIASILIKGTVTGSPQPGDHFGFVAQQIGTLTVSGHVVPRTAGVSELTVGTTDDVTLRVVS